jgi:hypothetical protein
LPVLIASVCCVMISFHRFPDEHTLLPPICVRAIHQASYSYTKLKPTRTPLLKQTLRIHLLTNTPQELDIFLPITSKRLLPPRAVVQIPIPMLRPLLPRKTINLLSRFPRDPLYRLVILPQRPINRKTDNDQRLRSRRGEAERVCIAFPRPFW